MLKLSSSSLYSFCILTPNKIIGLYDRLFLSNISNNALIAFSLFSTSLTESNNIKIILLLLLFLYSLIIYFMISFINSSDIF